MQVKFTVDRSIEQDVLARAIANQIAVEVADKVINFKAKEGQELIVDVFVEVKLAPEPSPLSVAHSNKQIG